MVSAYVVDATALDERPNLWLLEMIDLVFICGCEVSAHGAVVVCYYYSTAAGWVIGVDTIFDMDTWLERVA